MREVSAKTWYAAIWIAGDYQDAVRICRFYCHAHPLCVAITPVAYCFHGGMEDGVCVRIIQYPRFPESEADLLVQVRVLAETLRGELCQKSYSIECPDTTYYSSVDAPR